MPQACAVGVLGELRLNYHEIGGASRLGCPLPGQDYSTTEAAAARFERGQMYWLNLRDGRAIIVVIYYDSAHQVSYQIFEDGWREGDPETADMTPPASSSRAAASASSGARSRVCATGWAGPSRGSAPGA